MNLETVATQLAEQFKSALASRDATIADLTARLKAMEDRPAPKDGKDGADGAPGEKGDPGDATAALEGLSLVESRVKALEERPAPRDGRDGIQGVKGDPG